jgi:hypothetical protein
MVFASIDWFRQLFDLSWSVANMVTASRAFLKIITFFLCLSLFDLSLPIVELIHEVLPIFFDQVALLIY